MSNISSINDLDIDDNHRDKINNKLNNNPSAMITPPPQHLTRRSSDDKLDMNNSGMDILSQKARRSHRRNQSEDYDPLIEKYGNLHRHHQSSTFIEEELNLSNNAELTQYASELTKNTIDTNKK